MRKLKVVIPSERYSSTRFYACWSVNEGSAFLKESATLARVISA